MKQDHAFLVSSGLAGKGCAVAHIAVHPAQGGVAIFRLGSAEAAVSAFTLTHYLVSRYCKSLGFELARASCGAGGVGTLRQGTSAGFVVAAALAGTFLSRRFVLTVRGLTRDARDGNCRETVGRVRSELRADGGGTGTSAEHPRRLKVKACAAAALKMQTEVLLNRPKGDTEELEVRPMSPRCAARVILSRGEISERCLNSTRPSQRTRIGRRL